MANHRLTLTNSFFARRSNWLLLATLVVLPHSAPVQRAAAADGPAMEFSVNGVTTDVYGSGGTGYTGEDVRQSDSHLTGGAGDRAMEVENTANYTGNQQISRSGIPAAGAPVTTTKTEFFATLDKTFNNKQPGQLPPTTLDSFVVQAGGQREFIYGDEGVFDIPPMFGFTEASRINAGINSGNLTTGHQDGSLPEAWGYPQ